MANPLSEATPLGFGATAFGSSFDPVKAGQQANTLLSKKADEAKADHKAKLDKSLESMNPDLGKLKWTSPYLNEYEGQIKQFRDKNVGWYRKQDGLLTGPQIAENQIFEQEMKAKYELLNAEYDNFDKLRLKVNSDPTLNTPENQKEIERFSDPFKFDPEGIKKAGGMLEYITANPLKLTEKPEQLDLTGMANKILDLAGTNKSVGGTKIDPVTGEYMNTTTEATDLNKVQALSSAEYDSSEALQRHFSDKGGKDAWLRYANEAAQGEKKTVSRRDNESGGTSNNVGGAKVSNKLRVSQTAKNFDIDVERKVQENLKLGNIPAGMNKTEAIRKYKEAIPTTGWAVADKNNKPLAISSYVNSVGIITDKGIVPYSEGMTDADGNPMEPIKGNLDMKIHTVSLIPTTNQAIDLKVLGANLPKGKKGKSSPRSVFLDHLKQRAGKDGILPQGFTLTKRELSTLKNLGYGDAISSKPYGVGQISNIQNYVDQSDTDRSRKQIGQDFLIPYEDIKGQMNVSGFELPDIQKYDKGFRGKVISQNGVSYTWNDQTNSYE